jgi:biopolymer transport protein ExbD
MPLKTTVDETPTLNLVSMIDVMLVLIIFFTVGTTFIDAERNIDVKLPEVRDRGALTPAPDKKVINVSESGAIMIDRQSVSTTELEHRLRDARSQYAQLGVVVRGDRAVRLQTLAEVLQACKEAGIQDLGISVKLER